MKRLQTCLAAALLALLGVGCSSSSSTPAATTTTPDAGSAGLTACHAYCTAMGTKCATTTGDAGVDYPSATACETEACGVFPAAPSATCESTAASYFECLQAQTNICAEGCAAEKTAMTSAC